MPSSGCSVNRRPGRDMTFFPGADTLADLPEEPRDAARWPRPATRRLQQHAELLRADLGTDFLLAGRSSSSVAGRREPSSIQGRDRDRIADTPPRLFRRGLLAAAVVCALGGTASPPSRYPRATIQQLTAAEGALVRSVSLVYFDAETRQTIADRCNQSRYELPTRDDLNPGLEMVRLRHADARRIHSLRTVPTWPSNCSAARRRALAVTAAARDSGVVPDPLPETDPSRGPIAESDDRRRQADRSLPTVRRARRPNSAADEVDWIVRPPQRSQRLILRVSDSPTDDRSATLRQSRSTGCRRGEAASCRVVSPHQNSSSPDLPVVPAPDIVAPGSQSCRSARANRIAPERRRPTCLTKSLAAIRQACGRDVQAMEARSAISSKAFCSCAGGSFEAAKRARERLAKVTANSPAGDRLRSWSRR